MHRVTIKDVARRAGVAVSTVSHVINKTKFVSPRITRMVRKALREFDYQPNTIARSFRRKLDDAIGLVVPISDHDMSNMYFSSITYGVEKNIDSGSQLILGGSRENYRREVNQVSLFRNRQIKGLILAPATGDISYLHDFFSDTFPVVVIDRRAEGFPADEVIVDGRSATNKAVEILIRRGCTRIGFLSGPLDVSTAEERLRGYQMAIRQAGLRLGEKLVREGIPAAESGYKLAGELLDSVDALFVANNILAIGVASLVRDMKVEVPKRLRIIVYDDYDWLSATTPPLTAIRQPAAELGATAARLLFDRMAHPDRRPKLILLEASLIERGSS